MYSSWKRWTCDLYVDDVLIASPHEGFAKKVHELLNSVVPAKITGVFTLERGVNLSLWVGSRKDCLVNQNCSFRNQRIWTVLFRIIRLGAGELNQMVLQCRTFE